MKTYLTTEEFATLFFNKYGRSMQATFNASVADRIIWSMFQEFEKDVKETLEGAMWNIDEFTGDNASELIGYQFHKSFRQTDPIDARYINGILWTCMQDAPIFWKTMDRCCKILVSEEAAEVYKDEEWT